MGNSFSPPREGHGRIIRFNRGVYSHEGIYDGRLDEIIHYTGELNWSTAWRFFIGASKGVIQATPAKNMLHCENPKNVEFIGVNTQYSPDEIVANARLRIGEVNYNALLNNCQHFAMWASTGKSTSHGVSKVGGFFGSIVSSPSYRSLQYQILTGQDSSNLSLMAWIVPGIGHMACELQNAPRLEIDPSHPFS